MCCTIPECPRVKFLGSLIFALGTFAITIYGGISEELGDEALYHQLQTVEAEHIGEEIKWLKVYLIYFLVNFCLVIAYIGILGLLNCRLSYKQIDDPERFKQHQKRIDNIVRYLVISLAIGGCFKTMLYGSFLNKFRAQGMWDGTNDFDIKSLYVLIPYFGTRDQATWTVQQHLKFSITVTCFNVYKAMVLFIPMAVIDDPKIWKKLGKQILFIIPSAFLAAIVGSKGVSATMVEHYTQRFFTEHQHFSSNGTIARAVVVAIFGIIVMVCLLLRVTQHLHNKFYPITYTVPIEALEKINRQGAFKFFDEMLAFTAPNEGALVDADIAERHVMQKTRELMNDFVIRFAFSNCAFFSGLIGFALTLDVHTRTGLWSWYFTVEAVYSGVMWIIMMFDCCCSCCEFGKRINKKEQE